MGSGTNHIDAAFKATFANPHNLPFSERSWSWGFQFRNTDSGYYRVGIHSGQVWFFLYNQDPSQGPSDLIASGSSTHINVNSGASNDLEVIALGTKGFLFVNNQYTAELDLSGITSEGDIALIGALFTNEESDDDIYAVNNFVIRPILTHSSDDGTDGTITNDPNTSNIPIGSFIFSDSGGNLDDYIVTVNFDNTLASTNGSRWDYSIAEGPPLSSSPGYLTWYLVLMDTGYWYHMQRTASGDYSTIASAQSSAINTASGGNNQITLVIRGNTGILFVNNQFITVLDNTSLGSNGRYLNTNLVGAATHVSYLVGGLFANANIAGTEFTDHYIYSWYW